MFETVTNVRNPEQLTIKATETKICNNSQSNLVMHYSVSYHEHYAEPLMNFPHDDFPSLGKDISLGNCLECHMQVSTIVFASRLLARACKSA